MPLQRMVGDVSGMMEYVPRHVGGARLRAEREGAGENGKG